MTRLGISGGSARTGLLIGAAAGVMSCLALPAAAQQEQAGSEAFGLGDIVVTATRRASDLQTIGVAVSAFTAETLRERNVIQTEDLTSVTPGLSLVSPGGSQLAGLVAIRGVAQNDFAAHLESANVLYVDDVYRPSNGSNLQTLYDVERIEVLKGPQGTLFGRNATGGLIHIITADPVYELDGYIELTVAEYEKFSGQGAINLPLGDAAALRVAFFANSNDGWMKNDIGPDQFDDETLAFRGKFLAEPAEGLRLLFQAEYSKNEQDASGGGFPTGGFVGPDTLGQFRGDPPSPTDSGYVDADGSPFTGSFDFDGGFEREEFTLIANLSYETGPYTFTSITSYSELDSDYTEDNDLTPVDIAIFSQATEQQNFTQELRVNADYEAIRITAGAYYLNIDGDYFQGYQINNLGNFNQILAPIPILLLPVGLNQFGDYSIDTKSWSLFAQGEVDLGDAVTLTAGLRYTRDKKDYSYLNTCQSLIPAAPACPPAFDPATLAGAGLVTDAESEGGVSARLQMDYRATDDWLLYASYNRGYKAFNYNAGFAGAAPVAGARFDGEKLNAFEVGSKLDFFDGRARFNAAAFYYDYQDYQAFDQRGTSFILSNADATIYGAEAELSVSPGGGFTGFLGVSLVDTKVEDIPVGGQLLDREAPQASDLIFSFSAAQDIAVGEGTVTLSVDGNYTSSYFSQLNNAPVTRAGDNWLVNARLAYRPPSARWDAALFVRNLFNEKRLVYAFDITFPGNGLVEQAFGTPQWIGGQVRFNF